MSIGNEIGSFIKTDLSTVTQKWKKSIRMQVEIDILNPLKSELIFSCSSRPRLLIEIRYERLVDFCYSCGLIGHKIVSCTKKVDSPNSDHNMDCFGPWMKIENSHIPNPKFNTLHCNLPPASPDGRTYINKPSRNSPDGKIPIDWPIPISRQPQRPPMFLRKPNSSGDDKMTVDLSPEKVNVGDKDIPMTKLNLSLSESSFKPILPTTEITEKGNVPSESPKAPSVPPGFKVQKSDNSHMGNLCADDILGAHSPMHVTATDTKNREALESVLFVPLFDPLFVSILGSF
ncbi:hypothetical protein CASFOL_018168 [Castilleja foliolosa]|uniref:Zinc knuckle CX2CX4HX4C domain-containing protein n=1 Tax=Castilleja foliolosa TaxID=1961234 RepID=A0ABD3D9Y9_9LAMI